MKLFNRLLHRMAAIMNRFFNYYSVDSQLKSTAHKLAIFSTIFMPLNIIIILVVGLFSAPAALLVVVAMSLIYLLSAAMTISTWVSEKSFRYSAPLLISTMSGPLYASLLLLFDPSLTGFTGLALWGVVPLAAIIMFVIHEIKKIGTAENVIEYVEESETLELEAVED